MSDNTRLEAEYLRRRGLMLQLTDTCEKSHPASSCLLQGIILQLDWQWQSGRWNPKQTGGSGWWQLANYTLTAWVAEAAIEAGIVQCNPQNSEDFRTITMPRRVATAWKSYFNAVIEKASDSAAGVSQAQLTRLYWLAHDACLDEITLRFSEQLDLLPPHEKKFASSWISLVRVLAKIRFNPGIRILKRLQKLLPTVILDDSGWAASGVFSRSFVHLLAGGHRMLGLVAAV